MSEELELLAEAEVEPAETREILRRLAMEEFGGADVTRVRDISELTGTSVESVGRILADIRRGDDADWRVRIEAQIRHQDRKIGELSEPTPFQPNTEMRGYLWSRASFRPLQKRDFVLMGKALLAVVAVLFVASSCAILMVRGGQ